MLLVAVACSPSDPPAAAGDGVAPSSTKESGAEATSTSSTAVLASTTTTTIPPTATGLLTFRGNATRSYYGTGPLPDHPAVLWESPDKRMCSMSTVGAETFEWCGTGWTGQPAVVERGIRTWVIFGAYDGAVHFLDAATGLRLLPDFKTGDLIKGSVTVDPDGFPLVYIGSRDNSFRVIAFDRPVPTELWRLDADAVAPTLWNDDWDGAGLVTDDYLLEGGENSQFHAVRLNRSYGADGKVVVDPVLAFHAPGWDDELLEVLDDYDVSIESSVALDGGVAYFANSGGLVQGWDVSGLLAGPATAPAPVRPADAGVPLLDGRRRGRHRGRRRRGHALRGGGVGAPHGAVPPGGADRQARPVPANPLVWSVAETMPGRPPGCGPPPPSGGTWSSCPRTAAACSGSTGPPAACAGPRSCPARCGSHR